VAGLGIGDAGTAAIAFVADWYGAPFDAVNLGRVDRDAPSWGIWGFAGERLARCLGRWKARAADSYGEILLGTGLDVMPGPDGPLLLVDGVPTPAARGAARPAVGADPRVVTALARAGRHADAQLAQIASIAHDVLAPMLAIPAAPGGSEPRLGELIRTPRGLSVLLYLDLKLGPGAVRQIARTVIPGRVRRADERGWLDLVTELLAISGRPVAAHNVMRIRSSPELDRG
jgi:hypothetical protein